MFKKLLQDCLPAPFPALERTVGREDLGSARLGVRLRIRGLLRMLLAAGA